MHPDVRCEFVLYVDCESEKSDPTAVVRLRLQCYHYVQVLFEVRRCQFSALVEAGRQQEALAFARAQLTPLAGGDAELMQEVQ